MGGQERIGSQYELMGPDAHRKIGYILPIRGNVEGLRALPYNVQAASTVLQTNNDGLLLPLRAEDGRRIRRQMAVVDLVQRLQRQPDSDGLFPLIATIKNKAKS